MLERELQKKTSLFNAAERKKEVCSAYVERVSEKSLHIATNGIEAYN
jgi:hypothetical protein